MGVALCGVIGQARPDPGLITPTRSHTMPVFKSRPARIIVVVTVPENHIRATPTPERTIRTFHTVPARDLDAVMARNVAAFGGTWPGPGEVYSIGRPTPGGTYLGSF
jgi:hypothetical protein